MCEAKHPEHGVQCELDSTGHMSHFAIGPTGTVKWRNEGVGPVPLPQPKARNGVTEEERKTAKAVQEAIKTERGRVRGAEGRREPTQVILGNGRRNVGVQSSVQPDDPEERMEGADQAYQAIEPEFREAAMEGGRYLSRKLPRWTADDFWDWLDTNGHYTEHPKAMAGLLRSLIKEKVIEPVSEPDPDSHRPPRRSNKSRLLRVYRSLIYVAPVLTTTGPPTGTLRHFE